MHKLVKHMCVGSHPVHRATQGDDLEGGTKEESESWRSELIELWTFINTVQ